MVQNQTGQDQVSPEVLEAIQIASGDLSGLNPEQLNNLMEVLGSANTGANSPAALALAKVAKTADDRIKKNEQADINKILEGLTPNDAQWIDNNTAALEAIAEKQNEAVGSDRDRQAEKEAIKDFYDRLNIMKEVDADEPDKEAIYKDMMEAARNEAIASLALDKGFAKLSQEEKEKAYEQAFINCAQNGQLAMVTSEYGKKLQKYANRQLSDEEKQERAKIEAEMQAKLNFYRQGGKGQQFDVGASTASAVVCRRSQNLEIFADNLHQRTGAQRLWSRIKKFDKDMSEKHPKAWSMGKKVTLTFAVSTALGPIGAAGLASWRAYQAVNTAYKDFKEKSEGQSFFKHLVKNPSEAVKIGAAVAGAGVSVFFAGADTLAEGLQHTTGLAGKLADGLISEHASSGGNWVEMSKGIIEKANPTNWSWEGTWNGLQKAGSNIMNSPKKLSRAIVSSGTAVANSAIEIGNIFSKENKGQRWKAARKAFKATAFHFIAATGGTIASEAFSSSLADAQGSGGNAAAAMLDENKNGISDYIERPGAGNGASKLAMGKDFWEKQGSNQFQGGVKFGAAEQAQTGEFRVVPENEGGAKDVLTGTASAKDLTFWDNRAEKFLGHDNTAKIYDLVGKGQIKLPEGIETPQEFAYKLAMDIQQTPAEVCQAMGVPFQSSAALTANISNMTPEQFAKLSDSMNHFSDRGHHLGGNGNVNTAEQGGKQTELKMNEPPLQGKPSEPTYFDPAISNTPIPSSAQLHDTAAIALVIAGEKGIGMDEAFKESVNNQVKLGLMTEDQAANANKLMERATEKLGGDSTKAAEYLKKLSEEKMAEEAALKNGQELTQKESPLQNKDKEPTVFVEPISTTHVPSYAQAHDVAAKAQMIAGEKGVPMNKAWGMALAEEVKLGHMTQDQAINANELIAKSAKAFNGDVDKAVENIKTLSAAKMAEEAKAAAAPATPVQEAASNVAPETSVHKVENGSYHVNKEGKLVTDFKTAPALSVTTMSHVQGLQITQDSETKMYSMGGEKSTDMSVLKSKVNNSLVTLNNNTTMYNDMSARLAANQTLAPVEKAFMSDYEKRAANLGLKNEGGKLSAVEKTQSAPVAEQTKANNNSNSGQSRGTTR